MFRRDARTLEALRGRFSGIGRCLPVRTPSAIIGPKVRAFLELAGKSQREECPNRFAVASFFSRKDDS